MHFFRLFFITLISIIQFQNLHAQNDAKEMLNKAYEKALTIKNGYYEMTMHVKRGTKPDTFATNFQCYFKKLDDKDPVGFAFNEKIFTTKGLARQVIYTGNESININFADSTGIFTSREQWPDVIKEITEDYDFYGPLVMPDNNTIEHKFSGFQPYVVTLIGEEKIHGTSCQNIQVDYHPKENQGDIKILRSENHYWISPEDFMVRQYSKAIDFVIAKDTNYQYDKFTLDSVRINDNLDGSLFSKEAIQAFVKLQDFTPYKPVPPLSNGVIAPDFNLKSTSGKDHTLSQMKGGLVLLDFFYRQCYGCLEALPGLMEWNEKYSSKGLTILGIDPVDPADNALTQFLKKNKINYPVLIATKETATMYQVHAYPTIYLINAEGKIIHSQIGYSKATEKKLEMIIEKNLKL